MPLNPVIEIGIVKILRQERGLSQETYILNPEAGQFTDSALAAWCYGADRHRWGESVERNAREVRVTVYRS